METILLAVDGSDTRRIEKLISTAIEIAGPTGSTVKLAHVFEREEFEKIRSQLDFGDESEVSPDQLTRRFVAIREIEDALEDAGVSYTLHGRMTNGQSKGEALVALAREYDADLVIVGGRKRSPAGKAVFGSTAQEVMLHSPCPVTFVRDTE